MISFYNLKNEEYKTLNQFVDKIKLERFNNNEIMTAYENDILLGVCFYEVKDEICRINHLYSKPYDSTIEDALIRCIISNMDNIGVHEIVTTIEREQSFYCKIGFNPLKVNQSMIDLKQDEMQLFQLNTKDFFGKSCCKKNN